VVSVDDHAVRVQRSVERWSSVGICQFRAGSRWHRIEGVELTMGMGNRGSDFWTAIFEDQYVVNIGTLAEGEGTLCPEINQSATLLRINRTEMRIVIG
jgi:hypothetical protein